MIILDCTLGGATVDSVDCNVVAVSYRSAVYGHRCSLSLRDTQLSGQSVHPITASAVLAPAAAVVKKSASSPAAAGVL